MIINAIRSIFLIQYKPATINKCIVLQTQKNMNLLKHLKSGAGIVPPYLIFIYFLFYASDLGITYLASPDLKYEGNIYVRFFHLNWSQILVFFTLHALLVNVFFLAGLNFIHTYYKQNDRKERHNFLSEVFHKKKLLLSFFIFGYFSKQLFYSIYITVNNYLSYIYIFKIENVFTKISTWYINIEILVYPYFFPVLEGLFITIAIIYTFFKGKQIEKRYRTTSQYNYSLV
jgi:hypothetical protein